MKNYIFVLLIVPFFSCTHSRNVELSRGDIRYTVSDSLKNEYEKIIDGLKLDYVLYYRDIVATNTDLKSFGLPKSEIKFKRDSAKYYSSYQKFFNQDKNMIYWLLNYKNDTLKSDLWHMYLSPLSSNIGECHLIMSNSRAAIVLLQNFMEGKGFICFECPFKDTECNLNRYEEIEKWVDYNREKRIDELRKEWKINNPF